MTNLALLLILCVWHSVISKFYSENKTVSSREYIAIIVFAAMYLIVLLILALFALCTVSVKQRFPITEDSEEHSASFPVSGWTAKATDEGQGSRILGKFFLSVFAFFHNSQCVSLVVNFPFRPFSYAKVCPKVKSDLSAQSFGYRFLRTKFASKLSFSFF